MRFAAVLLCLVLLMLPAGSEGGFQVEVISVGAAQTAAPRIYLYHTHTLEAYTPTEENPYTPTETWRTLDQAHNMVRVGAELKEMLERAGFLVFHDTNDYERPDLTVAYARSLEGLEATLQEPYDLYIDLHRDSYSVGNGKNTVEANGKTYARVLFLVGKGTGVTGVDEKPDWQHNAGIATQLSDFMNEQAADISRGISYKSGRYNQHVAPCCLLIEVGNNKNTLDEALATMQPLSLAICQYFDALD